nr:interleukin 17-2 [Sepiella japonica]
MNSLRLIYIVLTLTYVSGAPLNTICQVPKDLHIHYAKLSKEMKGFAFLTLTPNVQLPLNSKKSNYTKTCPSKLLEKGKTNDRATCPWYNSHVYNAELFPSNWTEAVCICDECIGYGNKFNCEPVLTPTLFLKRSKCADGLYVYEVYQMQVKTGCSCTQKSRYSNEKSK